ncbi:hypothetical protein [Kaarinaea lacus]
MKKNYIIAATVSCCVVFAGSVLAYGGISNTASAMSSNRFTSSNAFSISINVPYDMSIKSGVGLSASSGKVFYTDFDATQMPVHELPPLPLTLDEAEKLPD